MYPNGRQIQYVYPSSGDGAVISRVDTIRDFTRGVDLAQYDYAGAGRIAEIRHPTVTGGLALTYGPGSNFDGWDRFGRVVRQQWKATGGTDLDRTEYTYDRNGNRLTKDVLSTGNPGSFDESYTYDGLDRLASFKRGSLTGGSISTANSTFGQDWSALDSLGNWRTIAEDADGGGAGSGQTQTRTHNAANEVLTNTGNTPAWYTPAHDAAGNMTTVAKPGDEAMGLTLTYDAWNRLVKVQDAATSATIAEYEYDGADRRIEKRVSGNTEDFFYNEDHQVLEVRHNDDADPREQYVWDLSYVDAPILRYRDANTDGTVDDTLYATFDANFNVTALVSEGGSVVERFAYTPYGERSVLDGNFAADADGVSDYAWTVGHQGLWQDGETGLMYNRARHLHPSLGRFVQRDPIGHMDGMNLYEYVRSQPLMYSDPAGTRSIGPTTGPADDTRGLVYSRVSRPYAPTSGSADDTRGLVYSTVGPSTGAAAEALLDLMFSKSGASTGGTSCFTRCMDRMKADWALAALGVSIPFLPILEKHPDTSRFPGENKTNVPGKIREGIIRRGKTPPGWLRPLGRAGSVAARCVAPVSAGYLTGAAALCAGDCALNPNAW
jgi:RHS repeat-associated protein